MNTITFQSAQSITEVSKISDSFLFLYTGVVSNDKKINSNLCNNLYQLKNQSLSQDCLCLQNDVVSYGKY